MMHDWQDVTTYFRAQSARFVTHPAIFEHEHGFELEWHQGGLIVVCVCPPDEDDDLRMCIELRAVRANDYIVEAFEPENLPALFHALILPWLARYDINRMHDSRL